MIGSSCLDTRFTLINIDVCLLLSLLPDYARPKVLIIAEHGVRRRERSLQLVVICSLDFRAYKISKAQGEL